MLGWGGGDLYCCPLVAQVWGDLAVLLSVVLMMQEWNMTSIRTVTQQAEWDEIKHHAASYVWPRDVPYTQLYFLLHTGIIIRCLAGLDFVLSLGVYSWWILQPQYLFDVLLSSDSSGYQLLITLLSFGWLQIFLYFTTSIQHLLLDKHSMYTCSHDFL